MKKGSLPLNLQFFAEDPANGGNPEPPANQNPPANVDPAGNSTPPAIDYNKIQQMLNGTLEAKENTALKAYFKEQGLSQQEVEQAITAFKEQKAKNEPNVEALQNQVTTAQQAMIRSQIENKALLMHQELGVDIGTISYLMKLVNLDGVVDQAGAINDEKLKEAFNKVLEDVPQLKKSEEQNAQGFRQVGAGQPNGGATPANTQPAVASKRWNRFN